MLPGKSCGGNLVFCHLVSGDGYVPGWVFRKFNMGAFSPTDSVLGLFSQSRRTYFIEHGCVRSTAMLDVCQIGFRKEDQEGDYSRLSNII